MSTQWSRLLIAVEAEELYRRFESYISSDLRAGQNLRASIGVWQWQKSGNNQVFPPKLATTEPVMVPLPNWSQR